jgi:hypothetical protein
VPRLFRTFHYPVPRRELADRFARVLAAVGRPGQGVWRLLFFFSDSPLNSVSAMDRMVRAFPQAAPFLYQGLVGPPHHRPADARMLSNYPPPWTEHNPHSPEGSLAPEVLEEILRGIPRRFPVFDAGVIFDGVDWAGAGEGLAAGPAGTGREPVTPMDWGYLFPSVSIRKFRDVHATAVIACDDPSAPLDPVTRGKLEQIGRSRQQQVRAGFSPAELAEHLARKAEAERALAAFEAQAGAWLAERVRLPFEFPPERDLLLADVRFSLKDALGPVFGSRGYRHAPHLGDASVFILLKATSGHHVLELCASRGTWSRSISCQFRFAGLETLHTFNLPSGPERRFQYAPGDQEQVVRVVANWGAVVDALERDLVPRLEAIYGADPPWFPAISMKPPGGRRAPRHRDVTS